MNVPKGKIISFSEKRTSLLQNYYLNGVELDRVNHVKGLGINFDQSFSFNKHYAYMPNKASSMLGFISRCYKDFNHPLALKSLNCAFVRSVFVYNSFV